MRVKCLRRKSAAIAIIVTVSRQLFQKSGTYTDIFQYHLICMMLAFVMVLPDVVRDVRQLRQVRRRSPFEDKLPRNKIIMRHQLDSFVMELAAAGGSAAVEYTKVKKHYPHLKSLHGIVGVVCGVATVCQVTLSSILRYVLTPADPKRPMVQTAHKCISITITVTAMAAMVRGFLATEYAARVIPSSPIRTAVSLASVVTIVGGFFL